MAELSALVEQAQRDDRAAFDALAASRVDRLYGAARLILRDADGADDAVQEALVRAWRDLPALRDPERLDAWLNRLLVRACYDEGRRRHRRRVEVGFIGIEPAVDDPSFWRVSEHDAIERAFRHLGEATGSSSSSSTSSSCPRQRWRQSSTSPRGPSSRDPTSRSTPCGRLSRRRHAPAPGSPPRSRPCERKERRGRPTRCLVPRAASDRRVRRRAERRPRANAVDPPAPRSRGFVAVLGDLAAVRPRPTPAIRRGLVAVFGTLVASVVLTLPVREPDGRPGVIGGSPSPPSTAAPTRTPVATR